MSKYNELKQQVYSNNIELFRHNVTIFTFGNASAVDREAGVFAIKPSGINYKDLKPEDIAVLDLDGKKVEGSKLPSSDTKTHLTLYKNFPNIGGIVHTHSTYAVAWSQAAKPIPILGTTHADHISVDIPCTDFMTGTMIKSDYEVETGNQILQTFKNISYEKVEMVLVAGHGPFTWGTTSEKAVYNGVILEELARMAYLTIRINPGVARLDEKLIQKHYERKHGINAYYGQKIN